MIVENRTLNSEDPKKNSEIEKIIKQAHEKQKLKKVKEKKLAKQAKLKEKKRIKEEKKLARKMEKQIKKDSKITEDSNEKNEKITSLNNNEIEKSGFPNIFHRIKESIVGKNLNKPYPDINDIPK